MHLCYAKQGVLPREEENQMLQWQVDEDRCVGCGECVTECPVGIIELRDGVAGILPHREKACLQCQHCLAVCPVGAFSMAGVQPDACAPLGEMPAPEAMDRLLRQRRSCRRFAQKPVEPALFQRLVEALAYAPTGKNVRATRFTVVDDVSVMERLRHTVMEGVARAAAEGTLPEGLGFFAALARRFAEGQDLVFRKAPHMIIASSPKGGPSPEADVYIALAQLELLAQSLGLGTLWCGFATWAIQAVVPHVARSLGIPEDHVMYVMLLGYPAVRFHRAVQREIRHSFRVTLDLQSQPW
jgi:nitroreductase/ferredoxin